MLTFQHFKASYGQTMILQIQEVAISAGVHWIKGGNGSGKTTLFKVLAGLLPYQGEITLHQTRLDQEPLLHRQYINYGEAEPLYPTFLTGQELVSLFAKAKKAPAQQAQTLATLLQIDAFLHQPTGTYSSGMLKKLSLLLAFLGTPKLILLDEPLITLDVDGIEAMYSLIGQYQAQGTSFLLTSHQDMDLPDLSLTGTWQVKEQTLRPLSSVLS